MHMPVNIFTARRDAIAIFAVVMCLSVRPSVKSRYSIETTGRIELVFGTKASFHLSYTVLWGNSGISTNKGTCLWNFVSNSGLLPLQVDLVNKTRSSTVEVADHIYTGLCVVAGRT